MAKIYAELIRKGVKTLEEVPERLKAEVRTVLLSLGCGLAE